MFLVYGDRRPKLLTPFELTLHKCLTTRLSVNPYRLAWHVPLSQIFNHKDYPKLSSLILNHSIPFIIIDLPRNAHVIGVGLYPETDPRIVRLLEQAEIAVFHLHDDGDRACQQFISLIKTYREPTKTRTLINSSEFKTKLEFETNLRNHLKSQYFDHNRSFVEAANGTSDLGKMAALYHWILLHESEPRIPVDRLNAIEKQLSDFRNRLLIERGDPYDNYLFLHEFSVARLFIYDKPAETFDHLSDYWRERIDAIAKNRLHANPLFPSNSTNSITSDEFYARRLDHECKNVHSEILNDSDSLNDSLQQHSIDILVLTPEGQPVIAIEFDGPHHDDLSKQQKDKLKNDALYQLGIPCLRIPYWFRPLKEKGSRITSADRRRYQSANDHKKLCAFIFSWFAERAHRRYHELPRYKAELKQRSDDELAALIEERKSPPEHITNVQTLREELSLEDVIGSDVDLMFYELKTNLHNDSLFSQEIADMTRYKESYLKKQYGEDSLIFSRIETPDHSELTEALEIRDQSGRIIEKSELSIFSIGGSWYKLIDNAPAVVFLYTHNRLIDAAYNRMIRKYSKINTEQSIDPL